MGILLNRRRYMGGGSSLPYDAEIEYLESSGAQYIDTGITCSTSHEIRASMIGAGVQQNNNAYKFFGAGTAWNRGNIELFSSSAGNGISCLIQGYTDISYDYTKYFNVTVKDKIFTFTNSDGVVNGTCNRTTSPDVTTPYSMTIFALHRSSLLLSAKSIRCYRFQILLDDVFLIDLIPVRKGQVGYMYDRVSGQLFGNAGTGDFVLGNDI